VVFRLWFEFGNSREWALISEYLEVLELVKERLVIPHLDAALSGRMHHYEDKFVVLHEGKELAWLVEV